LAITTTETTQDNGNNGPRVSSRVQRRHKYEVQQQEQQQRQRWFGYDGNNNTNSSSSSSSSIRSTAQYRKYHCINNLQRNNDRLTRLTHQARYLSSISSDDDGEGGDNGDNGDDDDIGELVAIQDHLEELHNIPLEDVRNFCIIAHVDHGKSSLASRILEYTGNMGHERQLTAKQLNTPSTDNDTTDPIDTENSSQNIHNNTNSNTTAVTKDAKEEITLLDTLAVERERGITVKASAASMLYRHPSSSSNSNKWILLNMVDTPGHADFGMEVSKSLDSVEGAVLLFDAAQGVQAQTLSVYDKARMIGEARRKANAVRDGVAGVAGGTKDVGGIRILPALTKVDMPSARPVSVCTLHVCRHDVGVPCFFAI